MTSARQYLGRERTLVLSVVVFQAGMLAHSVHNYWFQVVEGMREHPPDAGHAHYMLFEQAPLPHHAPDAYRVAMPALGEWIAGVLHSSNMPWIAAGLDFLFAMGTLLTGYALVVWGMAEGPRRRRAVAVGLLLALVQVPLGWVIPWTRPETVPTSFYVLFAVACLLRARGNRWWTGGLLALTVWQGFVRPDVPLVLGAVLAVTSLLSGSMTEFGSRGWNLLTGVAVGGIGAGVQAYLKYVRMPGLTYWPDTPVIMLRENLHVHNWSNWLLAFGVYGVLGLVMARVRLGSIERLLLVSTALYLPLWATVGILDEVRIGVPFLFALSVVAARLGAEWLLGEECESAELG